MSYIFVVFTDVGAFYKETYDKIIVNQYHVQIIILFSENIIRFISAKFVLILTTISKVIIKRIEICCIHL